MLAYWTPMMDMLTHQVIARPWLLWKEYSPIIYVIQGPVECVLRLFISVFPSLPKFSLNQFHPVWSNNIICKIWFTLDYFLSASSLWRSFLWWHAQLHNLCKTAPNIAVWQKSENPRWTTSNMISRINNTKHWKVSNFDGY